MNSFSKFCVEESQYAVLWPQNSPESKLVRIHRVFLQVEKIGTTKWLMQEQISQWKKIVFQILDFRGFYLLNPPIDIHGTANRVRWRLNQILSALIAYFFLV